MPIITGQEPGPAVGMVLSLVPAAPGLRAVVAAPPDAASGLPVPSAVVGWVLVADASAAGGVRVDPVFLAGGVAWTPDQYRAQYGQQVTVTVK